MLKTRLKLSIISSLITFSACKKQEAVKIEPQPPPNLSRSAIELTSKLNPLSRARLLTAMAESFIEVKNNKQAKEVLPWALDASNAISHPEEKKEHLNQVARVYAQIGDLDGAGLAVSKLNRAEDQDLGRAHIVEQLALKRRFKLAHSIEAAISSQKAKDLALLGLVKGYVKARRAIDAGKLATKIKGGQERDQALAKVAAAYARTGQRGPWQAAWAGVRTGHFQGEAEAEWVRHLFRKGKLRDAIKDARNIESKWLRARTLAEIASKVRSPKKARKLFEEAYQISLEEREQVLKETALVSALKYALKKKRYQDLKKLKVHLRSKDAQGELITAWVKHYARAGRLKAAQAIYQTMVDDALWRSRAGAELTRLEADRGRFTEALFLMAKLEAEEVRLQAVAYAIVKGSVEDRPASGIEQKALKKALRIN